MTEQAMAVNPKAGMGTGGKCALGCGGGCLVMLIMLFTITLAGFKYLNEWIETNTDEFREKGFEQVVKGQIIEITSDVTEPTLYIGQSVKIRSDCTTNLAVIAQMCEVYGEVDGSMYFKGQMLIVQPSAHVKGDLDVFGQMIENFGTIDGNVVGQYQSFKDKSAKADAEAGNEQEVE